MPAARIGLRPIPHWTGAGRVRCKAVVDGVLHKLEPRRRMPLTLLVRSSGDPSPPPALPLAEAGRAYLLGRGAGCDLPLADADASREHVQLVRRGDVVLARDLSSRNGALLGDARLPAERGVPWRTGLSLRIGDTVLGL